MPGSLRPAPRPIEASSSTGAARSRRGTPWTCGSSGRSSPGARGPWPVRSLTWPAPASRPRTRRGDGAGRMGRAPASTTGLRRSAAPSGPTWREGSPVRAEARCLSRRRPARCRALGRHVSEVTASRTVSTRLAPVMTATVGDRARISASTDASGERWPVTRSGLSSAIAGPSVLRGEYAR